jgi:hypothetical protein
MSSKKVAFSVAMSKEDGCIVMIRSRGKVIEVVGSVPRAQSIDFAYGLLDWGKPAAEAEKAVYPH